MITKDSKKKLEENAAFIASFLGVFWVPASGACVVLMGFPLIMGPAFTTLYVCIPLMMLLSLVYETMPDRSFLIYDIVMVFMYIINVILSIVFFNP